MSTSIHAHVHHSFQPPSESPFGVGRDRSTLNESSNTTGFRTGISSLGLRGSLGTPSSTLSDLAHSLNRFNSTGAISSQMVEADHATLLEWIRAERMRKLPPEGSSYDKVLVWARLFVERLYAFDLEVEHFARDSRMATQVAYAHCAGLLGLGEENSSALLDAFSFFYRCSVALENLLGRTELFAVSQDIKDQLVLALVDLVTLVAGVSIQFHESLGHLTSETVSIDIHNTFSETIESFRTRCEHAAELMWSHQLQRHGLDGTKVSEIAALRRWLDPEDPILIHAAESTVQFAQEREESTCLWVKPHLTHFLKGSQYTWSITGKPGSGKSILATVIYDRLQHPTAGVEYKSIFVPINGRVPIQTTPRAITSSILSQLFAAHIGNVSLYQALRDAHVRCQETLDEQEHESVLWGALRNALQCSLKGLKNLVLVVDGVEEASCGQTTLLHRLREATSDIANVKLIVLASDTEEEPTTQATLHITADLIFDDISAVVRKILQHCPAFDGLSEQDREVTVDRIVEAADGSFLWAKLATKRIRDEAASNSQTLTKAVLGLCKAGVTIRDLVSHRLTSNVHQDARLITAWLASAARPLSIREVSGLLSVRPDKGTMTEDKADPLDLLKPLASLVFQHNNMIYLRHGQIRTAILEILAKSETKLSLKDSQIDLIQRLLVSLKHGVAPGNEPSLEPPDSPLAATVSDRDPVLPYALRYWVSHTCTVFDMKNPESLRSKLSQTIPSSPMAPLLAMTVWNSKSAPVMASLLDAQAEIYHYLLKDRHPATLQAVLCQALFYEKFEDSRLSQVSEVFYNAAKLAQQVLSVQHVITMQMTNRFLKMTASQITGSRTVVMTRRVEMLQLLVECYRIHYGATSDMVTSTLTQLAEHYQSIKEVEKSQEIITSLKGRTVESSKESTTSRRGSDESLLVELHGRKDTIAQGSTLDLDELEEDALISSSFDFESRLAQAAGHVRAGNLAAAERDYVDLWQQTSQRSRLQRSSAAELQAIKAVQVYCEFLKAQNRSTEAASILAGFWEQRETISAQSEDTASQLVIVATLMKSLGLPWQALSVLKQSARGVSAQSSLSQHIQAETQTLTEEVSRTASVTTSGMSESNLQEIVWSASSDSQLSATAASSLLHMYLSQHQWKDAIKILKKRLQDTWPSLFAAAPDNVALPRRNVQRAIELAGHLRDCYRYRHNPAKEEDITVRVFRAVRRGRAVGDRLLDQATGDLLHLYERTLQTDKLISVHEDILEAYTNHFGETHLTVLQELWTLAELSGPPAASLRYYQRIVQILNKDRDSCHPDAFEPLVVVATELANQGRFQEALHPCRLLFTSLRQPDKNPKLRDQDFARQVYERYIHCLRATRADAHVIHDETVQYRKFCLATFGATAAITIQATKTLANICQGRNEYEGEMVQLYEALLKTKSDQVDIDRKDIQTTLEAIYEEQTAVVTRDSTCASSEQLQRATTVYNRRLSSSRSTYGWAHETSLSDMEQLVSTYTRRGDSQAAVTLLQETAVQVISTEKSAIRLAAAARSLASSYQAAGQEEQAQELAEMLYRHVVAMDSTDVSPVKLNQTSDEPQSLLFLAQFEYGLGSARESSLTVNEIYAGLVSEYLQFERFRAEISSKSTPLQSIISTVSHLQDSLRASGRGSACSRLEGQFINYFVSTEGKKLQVSSAQATVFIQTLVHHFSTHASADFLRSVAIAAHARVVELIAAREYGSACDLATVAFSYVRAHGGFASPATTKLVFKMGLAVSGQDLEPHPDSSAWKAMLKASGPIVAETISYFKRAGLDLSRLDAAHLNQIISVLGERSDYHNLAWILNSLWDKREQQHVATQSDAMYTLALGRMLIVTRYLVGEYMAAIRLAEDIVYNCARVHGPRHARTVEMTVLLSQMYTSVAQGHQAHKDQRALAARYYKKAAALHENALRGFIDPSLVSTAETDGDASPSGSEPSSPGHGEGEGEDTTGKYVRQHLHLLKLAVERLGSWPKEYAEYERLNSDLFRAFHQALSGVEGMNRWNLKGFGSGRAESSDDLVSFQSHPHLTWNQGLAIPV